MQAASVAGDSDGSISVDDDVTDMDDDDDDDDHGYRKVIHAFQGQRRRT